MRVNFLTTDLSDASGGAIYDKNLFEILRKVYPNVCLYNDRYFRSKYKKGNNLISFNLYYRLELDRLFECEYLIINSRLYTRMMTIDIGKCLRRHSNTKLIVIHHHSNFMNNEGIRRFIHRFLEKKILCSAYELIIPNEFVIDQVNRDFKIFNIKHLPSSFEKKTYNVSPLTENTLLFVGNIEKRKGVWYGIRAFNEIRKTFPNYKYYIVGKYNEEDSYFIKLKQYVSENDLEDCVIFEGRVNEDRLNELYSSAKLFLFPSLLEGYGWVMIEAMARGVPVVAFNNSAMPYTVKDGINGLLISNKNSNEMANRVCDLLKDENCLKKLQIGALKTFENVPSQKELNKMTEEYIQSWR